MTAPRFAGCRCGHPKLSHELDLAPQCIAERCTCLTYVPKAAPPIGHVPSMPTPPLAVVPRGSGPDPLTIEALLQAGKRSDHKNIVNLTERIALMVHDLRGRLADERQHAEKRRAELAAREAAAREVAELEARLSEAKARLRGKSPSAAGVAEPKARKPRQTTYGEHPCPVAGCEKVSTTKAGLSAHTRFAHPEAAAS